MSETKFTPGPWHVEGGSVWAEAADGSILRIALPWAVTNYVSVAERNANARLIAAAPLMYRDLALCVAALKIARSLLLEAGGGEMPTVNAAIAQSEETLSKEVSQ